MFNPRERCSNAKRSNNGEAELHQGIIQKTRLRFSGVYLDVGLLPFVVCSEAKYDKWLVTRLGLSFAVVRSREAGTYNGHLEK